jgi:DNA-binding NarL/FixJ family response regulator
VEHVLDLKAKSLTDYSAVIADDHAMLRSGIRQILGEIGGIDVVAEAMDGLEAISLVRQHQPDLLTLDIAMPLAQGIEIYAEVRRWSPDTRIVIFTGMTSTGLLSQLITSGVDGLFLKRSNPEAMRDSIPIILNGGKVVAPDVMELLEHTEAPDVLTTRERQILSLIATGATNREIAERLGVSHKTIDNHRTNIMRKVNVHSVAELLSYALREGLLDTSTQL